MKFVDYYDVLGVADDASEDQIKQSYRKLARKYHPDVSREPDAEQRFKQVAEAYEVLKDPEKRIEFDQLRKFGGSMGREFHPPPGWQSGVGFGAGGYSADDRSDFSDFFSEIFGGRASGGTAAPGAPPGRGAAGFSMPGEDHTVRLEVKLEEAFQSSTRTITLQSPQVGADGQLRLGTRTLNVKIPAGVVDGQKIRLTGQGGAGRGGAAAGDLFLEILLAPHRRYTVEGRDISLVLPIAPWEAVLGATIEAPTLGGLVKVNIPAGAQAGQRLRLRGRGLPGSPPGDQFIVLEVAVPHQLTEDQRRLFEQMRQEIEFDPRHHLKGDGHE